MIDVLVLGNDDDKISRRIQSDFGTYTQNLPFVEPLLRGQQALICRCKFEIKSANYTPTPSKHLIVAEAPVLSEIFPVGRISEVCQFSPSKTSMQILHLIF